MRSEEDLVRTLRAGAGHVTPTGGLAAAVAARRRARRRRQRVSMALAAASVVLVAGGTMAVWRGEPRVSVEPAVAVTTVSPGEVASAVPRVAEVKPVAEVWPEAVFTMPAAAPDGWKYRPVTGISPTEVLLTAESSFEKAGRLEIYDTTARTTRVVGDMPAPEGVKGYFVQDVEVGERHFAWYGTTPNDSDKWADFWIIPREGGTAQRVGEVTGDLANVERIGLTEDALVWSVRDGGVHRLPLSGGEPEKVAGSDGLHLDSWPYAVGYAPGERGQKNQDRRVNLVTGEKTPLPASGSVTKLTCAAEWCYGDAKGGGLLVQGLDGSDATLLPSLGFHGEVLGDRFASVMPVRGDADPAKEYVAPVAVYDPATGKIAGVNRVSPDGSASYGSGTSSSPTTIMYWGKGPEVTVMNLAAVTRR
ncbi:hypothetical protein [Nonomuraea sp. NPDC003214]